MKNIRIHTTSLRKEGNINKVRIVEDLGVVPK